MLTGVIFIHRISDIRVGGAAKRSIRMLHELCGDDALRNIAIVTNMWEEVSLDVGEAREKELATGDQFFKLALERRAQLFRHDGTLASARSILSHLIRNQPHPLQIQRELVDEGKDISQT